MSAKKTVIIFDLFDFYRDEPAQLTYEFHINSLHTSHSVEVGFENMKLMKCIVDCIKFGRLEEQAKIWVAKTLNNENVDTQGFTTAYSNNFEEILRQREKYQGHIERLHNFKCAMVMKKTDVVKKCKVFCNIVKEETAEPNIEHKWDEIVCDKLTKFEYFRVKNTSNPLLDICNIKTYSKINNQIHLEKRYNPTTKSIEIVELARFHMKGENHIQSDEITRMNIPGLTKYLCGLTENYGKLNTPLPEAEVKGGARDDFTEEWGDDDDNGNGNGRGSGSSAYGQFNLQGQGKQRQYQTSGRGSQGSRGSSFGRNNGSGSGGYGSSSGFGSSGSSGRGMGSGWNT